VTNGPETEHTDMPNDSPPDGRPAGVLSSPPPPPWAQPPRDRRRRPPQAPLDRDRIVEAALAIVDRDGVEGLSIRRLAADLGASPMAVYWHVRDKAELLDLVGERVLEQIRIPDPAGDWREQLRDVHHAMLEAVVRHPNTADLMIGRARYGRAGITLFERLLSILIGAGLDPASAFDAYQSLYLFLLGYIATASRTPAFIEAQRQGVDYLRSLDATTFPSIAAAAPHIGSRVPREQFKLGLDVVIEGIAARLLPPG
jgi:AcrR family transcriptional regulator